MLFGSTILDVIVGLLFIYLLLSLLCSAIGEYIEAKFNNRAKYLKKGIELLLNDTSGKGVDLAERLYSHGLVRPLFREHGKPPSYIPSRTFALALWNMATAASDAGGGVTNDLRKIRDTVTKLPNEEVRTALLTMIDEANGDLDRARKNIEEWYEGMMDRVAGWYKRRTGALMLVLGIVVAAVINADTITLATALARDGALRSSVVAAAQQRLEAGPTPSQANASPPPADPAARDKLATDNLEKARADIRSLGLPLGWVWAADADPNDLRRSPATPVEFLLKLVGILITGFAVSQGAPFWFDVLNKFMVVRSTVKPKEKSAEQPSKDRPAPRTEIETDVGESRKG